MARLVLLLVLGLAAAGCTRGNDAYCCTDPALCADVGGVLDACRFGTICDDDGALEGVPHSCVNDPAAVTCAGPDDCAAPTPACVDRICAPCAADADCPDAATARCDLDTSRCVACDDGAQCTRFGSDTCSAGICVECAVSADPTESGECDSAEPICAAPGVCRSCSDHRECASGACDLGSGACVAGDAIAYVDATAIDGGSACTYADPCAEIGDGVATGRTHVVIAQGSYQEDLAITGQDVTLIGYGATLTAQTNGVVAIAVSGTATEVAISGLTIVGSAGGIDCNGGAGTATTSVTLEMVTVASHTQTGILIYRCNLIVHRSRVTSNAGGGIEITQGGFDITNSVIDGNGQLGTFGGIQLATPRPTPARLAFNTVVDNRLGSGTVPSGVNCASAAGLPAFHSNIITGNLDGSEDAQVSGQPNCAYEYSLINPATAGIENIVGDPLFTGTAYRIDESSPARDNAKPDTGVVDDVDGERRPADVPDIGADEFTPAD